MDQSVVTAMAQMREEIQKVITNLDAKHDGNKEAMERKIPDLEEMMKNISRRDKEESIEKTLFKYKDASEVKPNAWDASPFTDMAMELRTWAKTLHEDFGALLERAEKDTGDYLTKDNVDTVLQFPHFAQLDKYL